MLTKHYIFTDRLLGSLAEWQSRLDTDGFPIRLLFVDGSMSSIASVHAALSDGKTSFRLQVSHPREIVRSWHADQVTDRWRYAVALEDADTDMSAFTVTLAAIAYAERCGGVFYSPDGAQTIVTELDIVRREFEQVISFYLEAFGLAPDPRHP